MTDYLVPDPQVQKEFGISAMTLWRWTQDPKLDFPPIIKIRTRNYRSRMALDNFKIRQGYTTEKLPVPAPVKAPPPVIVVEPEPIRETKRPSIGWMEYAPGVTIRSYAVYKDVLLRSMAPMFYVGIGNHSRVADLKRNEVHQSITKGMVYGVDWSRYYIDSLTKEEALSRESDLIDKYMPMANLVPGIAHDKRKSFDWELPDMGGLKKVSRG